MTITFIEKQDDSSGLNKKTFSEPTANRSHKRFPWDMGGENSEKKHFSVFVLLVLPVVACLTLPQSLHRGKSPDTPPAQEKRESYGSLPLTFESNQGQTSAQVRFLSRGKGYTLFLTSNNAVLAMMLPAESAGNPGARPAPNALNARDTRDATRAVLRMEMVGANSHPTVTGLEELPGKANYFIGNDPEKWQSNVPLYEKVEYKGIYPGIDLVFYGCQRELEYDFVVSAGADPGAIRLFFEGGGGPVLDKEGNLVIGVGAGEVVLQAPLIYQEDAGGGRRSIRGSYELLGENRVGFQIAAYDTGKPIVIDPVLSYSTYLGGGQHEQGRGIAVNASGNAYVTGMTPSSDFPASVGAYDESYNTNGDVFVTKLNPTGTGLVYSTYIGGTNYEWAHALVLDAEGNAYVTGYSHSQNFPTTDGAYQEVKAGGDTTYEDAFVTKLNATGSALVYSTFLGGDQSDWGEGIALDVDDNAYVTGITHSSVFPTTPGAFDRTYHLNGDIFVARLNAAGSALVYSTIVGGALTEYGFGIAVDNDRNAYVTGRTTSTNLPTTPGAYQPAHNGGGEDGFVIKVNPGGTDLSYCTYLGGMHNDFGHGIVVDNLGNAYVTGWTASGNFPTMNPFQGTNMGPIITGGDAFLTKLNPAGTAILYSTFLGGSSADEGHSIAMDDRGNLYVAGLTLSGNFPTARPVQAEICRGCTNVSSSDAFVTKFNAAGSKLLYSTFLGGIQFDRAHAVAVDSSGNAYIVGDTASDDFPISSGAYKSALGLFDQDAYVAKIANRAAALPCLDLLIGD